MKAIYPVEFDVPHRGLEWLQWYDEHKVHHPGWDLNKGIGNQDFGNPILCPVNAEVEYVAPEPTRWNNYNGGLGKFIVLYHPSEGVWTRYAHMESYSVQQNQEVKIGQQIGTVGNTGTEHVHLHLEGWNQAGYDVQKAHHRRFAYYPSNQTKAWVQDHYFDVLAWIDEINSRLPVEQQVSKWAKEAQKNMMALGVTDGTRPQDTATREEIWVMLDRLNEA
ncbi:MAG: M23 family metallopeptidase [Nitrosomonadaceae bacterium]